MTPTRSSDARRGRALTVVAAVAGAVLAWLVAVPVAGLRLTVHTGSGQTEVGVAQVVIAGLLAGVAACVLLAVLERFSRRPRTVWTVTATTVLALSLTGPLSASSAAAGATLACLHLLVGGMLIIGLRRAP